MSRYLQYVRTEEQRAAKEAVVSAQQLREQPFRIYRVVTELNQIPFTGDPVFCLSRRGSEAALDVLLKLSRILTEKYIYGIIVYTVYQSCCEELENGSTA